MLALLVGLLLWGHVSCDRTEYTTQLDWMEAWAGDHYDFPTTMRIFESGNIVVTGTFHNALRATRTLRGVPRIQRQPYKFGDIYILSLAANGTVLGASQSNAKVERYGGAGIQVVDAVFDSDGNGWLVGSIKGNVTLSGIDISSPTTLAVDVFVAHTNPQGQFVWASTWRQTTVIGITSVDIDLAGNAYVASFVDVMDPLRVVPGQTITCQSAGALTVCPVMVKYDADGRALWAISSQPLLEGFMQHSAVAWIEGYTLIAGAMRGCVELTPGREVCTSTDGRAAFNGEHYLMLLDAGGDIVWFETFVTNEGLAVRLQLIKGANGVLYMYGGARGASRFGRFELYVTNAQQYIAALTIDTQGVTVQWVRIVGVRSTAGSIAADPRGGVVVTGAGAENTPIAGVAVSLPPFEPLYPFLVRELGDTYMYAAKLSETGSTLWLQLFQGMVGAPVAAVDAEGGVIFQVRSTEAFIGSTTQPYDYNVVTGRINVTETVIVDPVVVRDDDVDDALLNQLLAGMIFFFLTLVACCLCMPSAKEAPRARAPYARVAATDPVASGDNEDDDAAALLPGNAGSTNADAAPERRVVRRKPQALQTRTSQLAAKAKKKNFITP